MATWVALTEDDLRTAISGRELEAFRFAAKDQGEADPVAGIMNGVTEYVRGWVARYSKNQLGPEGTVPSSLSDAATDLIVWKIMVRSFGDVVDPQGARKDAAKAAEDLLREVAKGEGPAIFLPPEPLNDYRPAMLFSYSNQDLSVNEMTRADQDGSTI